jgi:hypothetical protein
MTIGSHMGEKKITISGGAPLNISEIPADIQAISNLSTLKQELAKTLRELDIADGQLQNIFPIMKGEIADTKIMLASRAVKIEERICEITRSEDLAEMKTLGINPELGAAAEFELLKHRTNQAKV